MNNANKTFWFVLGRQPLLAAAELSAVFGIKDKKIRLEEKQAILKIQLETDPKLVINKLGGTIKIAQELKKDLNKEELVNLIMDQLKKIEGKIHFGISYYGNNQFGLQSIQKFGLSIKKELKNQSRSVRYVQNREKILSSAVVENNKLIKKGIEFLIDDSSDNKFNLATSQAIQPFKQFSKRDYGRPGRDDKSGMLPPKLAMMMINLSKAKNNCTILDPFCGSGTILTESLLLNYKNIIGTDVSDKAITDTTKNIDWTINNYKLTDANPKLYQCSVDKISSKIKDSSIDTIITEPYMGKPLKGKESKQQLHEQAGELRDLYIQAFEQFAKIIKKDGTVVFIIPRFRFRENWIVIDCLKEIKKLGFLPEKFGEDEFLIYGRPHQYLAREIWKFVKK
jgi:tRNA G10  N-methylase Trm11